MPLEVHDALLHARELLRACVDQLAHSHLAGLACAVRAANRLQLGRGVPGWRGDVDPCRLLEVESHAARLDLDEEHRRLAAALEGVDAVFARLLVHAAVYPEDLVAGRLEPPLNLIHLAHKLGEDQRLLLGVLANHPQQRVHLGRLARPVRCLAPLLFGHARQVELRPRHHLPDTQQALQNLHLVHALRARPEDVPHDALGRHVDILVEVLLCGAHRDFHVLEVAGRQLEPLVQVLLGAPEHVPAADLGQVALHTRLGDAQDGAQPDKVLDRVEDGRAGHQPLDWRAQSQHGHASLALDVADLVGLVQDDAVPANLLELAVPYDRVGRHHHSLPGRVKLRRLPLCAVVGQDLHMRGELFGL